MKSGLALRNYRLNYLLCLLILGQWNCRSIDHQATPNILFIAIDDLRPELGCYGNEIIQTPNIDKLAAEGALFKRHYVQVPTCGPSRHVLLTGLRPRNISELSNQVTANTLANESEAAEPETFVHHLKRNGYYTVGIGKISHSADGLVYGYEEQPSIKRELPHSWDRLLFNSGKWGTGWNAFFGYADGENRQSKKKNCRPYEFANIQDDGYPDGLTAQLAIDQIEKLRSNNTPFFLGVGFFKPHLPFNAPQKYWNLYDRAKMPITGIPYVPENVHSASLHTSGEFNQYQLTDEQASLDQAISDDYARKLHHAYYAAVSYIDAQVGMLLKALAANNLDENTIVVLWGDHGWHLGDHNIWGKHTLFDVALNSALIIKAPDRIAPGIKIPSVVETVDIYPSLMELCGIPMTHKIDGQSFVPLLTEYKTFNDQVAYSYFRNGISMRTEQYRITKYFREERPKIELYDHYIDPLESKNIAAEHPRIIDSLLLMLEKGNTGLYKREDGE